MNEGQQQFGPDWDRAARPATPCPPPEQLAALAEGRAWPWQRRGLVRHLAHCGDCAGDFQVLCRARTGLLTELEALAESGPARPAFRPVAWTAAAAAGLCALVLVPWLAMDRPQSGPAQAGHSVNAPEPVFSTAFEGDQLASNRTVPAADDVLFREDFDNGGQPPERIHADHFSG